MKREFLQGLMDMPKEVVDAIMAENGRDIQQAKLTGEDWQAKYQQAVAEHEKAIRDLRFEGAVQSAIARAGGRNARAIAALLDGEALKGAEDPEGAVYEAVRAVKQECGYLFESPGAPPVFAAGTGTRMGEDLSGPATLADALRERFERK